MRRGAPRSHGPGVKALLGIGLVALLVPVASSASPPPGATARCRDGSYSYSADHSGTCSHHGGVAVWLDRSGASTDTSTSSTGTTSTSVAPLSPGETVPLKGRTRTSGCTLGALPDRRCSPGAYYSKLTRRVICSASFRTGTIRNVPESEKFAVEQEYGLAARHYGRTLEIDHIVSLELGGSNDIANLYPEEATFAGNAPGYHVKDTLENRMHALVCAGQMSLRSAQRQIASNWEKLYRTAFGAAP